MFILGDDTHDRGKIPWVTFTLIAVNILTFSAQCRFGDKLTIGFALTPKEVTEFKDLTTKQPVKVHGHGDVFFDEDGEAHFFGRDKTVMIPHYPGPFPIVLTFFTYMFLHGDIFHLLFNMWFLYIFGRNVECSLDHGRFLSFYLYCGVMAGIAQVGAEYKSVIPIVGASGAIAGIMGAYLAIFPWNNMKILWGGIGMMWGVVEVPAFVVVLVWFAGQFMVGGLTMHDPVGGGTAYWCHIGGALTGFCTIKGIVLYLQYQIRQIEAEQALEKAQQEKEEKEAGLEPSPDADQALPADDAPTQEMLDNLLDPVETFKRARSKVFRDTPENDPFIRPGEGPLVAELIKEEPDEHSEGIVASVPNLPRPRTKPAEEGIVANLPRARTKPVS